MDSKQASIMGAILAALLLALLAFFQVRDRSGAEDPGDVPASGITMDPSLYTGPSSYPVARDVLWDDLYAEGGHTLYCDAPFETRARTLSVEHVLPQSWMATHLGCETAEDCESVPAFKQMSADLHNLYPALQKFNSSRRNLPYDDLAGEAREYGDCDYERRDDAVEPRDEVKGNVARALLYMATMYGVAIDAHLVDVLRAWHTLDPPDNAERARHERIVEIETLANPFVIQPESMASLVCTPTTGDAVRCVLR